jgi:hypothetical protein
MHCWKQPWQSCVWGGQGCVCVGGGGKGQVEEVHGLNICVKGVRGRDALLDAAMAVLGGGGVQRANSEDM